EVDCIESSALACDFIHRNARLNHYQQRALDKKVHVICADAFLAMKDLHHREKKYGVIILDPPAFVKKIKDRKEGLIAYQRLNELEMNLLLPGGILISCSCSMHISRKEWIQLMQRAALRTHTPLQLLERGHKGPKNPIHPAVPETDYLKAVIA